MKAKNIILSIMIAAITVLSYSASAQKDTENRNDTMLLISNKVKHEMKSDHIMMQNGKVVMMKDGKTMPMDKEFTMKNGTIIMTSGQYKLKDGTTMMLKEGEMMDMNGKMIIPKKPMPK